MRKKYSKSEKPNKRMGLFKTLKKYHELYILFMPIAIMIIIFRYIPMIGIVVAFKDYSIFKGIMESPWVGLSNFKELFSSPFFIRSLKNTIIISLLMLVGGFPVPIIFAIMLDELQLNRYKKFIQTVSYLPHFISWAVAGGIFFMLLSPSSGVVNSIIEAFGGTAINFLGNSKYFRGVLVVTNIWKSFGWGAIIYIAALTGVDKSLYEASYIDGASRFQRIWYITIPSIMNVVVIMLILSVGNILNVGFEQIFVMVNDTVMDVGETIDYYIYRVGLYSSNNFSYATAVGLFKSLVGFFLIIGTNNITKRINDSGGIW